MTPDNVDQIYSTIGYTAGDSGRFFLY